MASVLFCRNMRYRTSVTFGVAGLILAVYLSGFGLNQQRSKRRRSDRPTITPIVIAKTAHSLVKLPPGRDLVPLDCEPTESKVKLSADATAPGKGDLLFTWQVAVGRLIGEGGREVTWDLSGVQEGTHTATVEVSDKHKHTAIGSVKVTVVVCPGWHPTSPCPSVSVSCPSTVESKASIAFEATVAGGPIEIKPTYKWSLSAGKIISGQATSKITIDVSGISGESVTATVSVGGFHPLCQTVASCTILEIKHE